MASRLGLLSFLGATILLIAIPLNREGKRQLVVWNVGQGQWVTLVEDQACWHFDVGGERAPWAAITRACRGRVNRVCISHWDWDHLSFAAQIPRHLPRACLALAPSPNLSPTVSRRKQSALTRLPACPAQADFATWTDFAAPTENDRSRVVWWDGILIPGDSTRARERIWISAFKNLRQTRLLILGHHGSQSSTSRALLNHLPELKMAVASARRQKYGHPHPAVRNALQAAHVALLTTEDWNSLYFDLD